MSRLDVKSSEVQAAVQDLQRRAERVTDPTKLREIYVESGVLRELSINSNQAIHGRRGVGKTHLLNVYRDSVAEQTPSILFQIHDCQRLGSGYASAADSPQAIAAAAFTQLLNDIATHSFDDLQRLTTRDATKKTSDPSHAVLAFQDAINAGGSNRSSFNFRAIGDTLDAFRANASAPRLVIGLDEFVAIPKPAQPYFAELIKRSFFSKPNISFVMAAVSYSTQTWKITEHGGIGFEPGADTFGDVDLDKYFVWEEDDKKAEDFFCQVLYNHLAEDLGLGLGLPPNEKKVAVIKLFFTQEAAFSELCRAAEGNCRDMLNIFRTSYFKFLRDSSSQRIGIPQVNQGAEEWFRSEKLRAVQNNGKLEEFLNHLIGTVIRQRRTKTFMVHYRDVSHPLLMQLYSARLLHPLRTVWKHPDQPGEPYHLITMDFGCYVALRNTASAPEERLFFESDSTQYDDLVPIDDRRSIRRVVVSREDLDRFVVA